MVHDAMSKPSPRQLTLISNQLLTPHMRRLVLGDESLADFPDVYPGSYIKLLFNAQGETDLSQLTQEQRPAMRTYSIRALDKLNARLTLDVVMHGKGHETGPGSNWAATAKPGQPICIAGPGHLAKHAALEEGADWVFFVGDATALPAIACYLHSLPAQTVGYALIQVKSVDDIQPLSAPAGVEIRWLQEEARQSLPEQVMALPWLPGRVGVWVACEFDMMRALRGYFRNQRNVPHQDIYISSYWRRGKPEDLHVIDKREDAQQFEAG